MPLVQRIGIDQKKKLTALMDLLVKTIASEVDELNENGVKLQAIGDTGNLPRKLPRSLVWSY